MSELRTIYNVYVFCQPIIEEAVHILQEQAKHPDAASHFRHSLDVIRWIKEANPNSPHLPSDAYLASAPISFPMIGLTQLCIYYATLIIWNKGKHKKKTNLMSQLI